MKTTTILRVLLTLVGLFALATQAQTTTLAIQQRDPDNSAPAKSSSDITAKEKLVLSRPAEMNDPPVEELTQADVDATIAKVQAQLQAQLSYLKAVVAIATRLSPAAAAMKEFIDDMKRSDYLADRMAELGTESAYTYWKAVYGGKAGYEALQY